MPIFSASPVRIQPYFGHRSETRLVISGRALRSGKSDFASEGTLRSMRTLLSQFASREAAGVTVDLEIGRPDGKKIRHTAISDKEGFVTFDIAFEHQWPLPDHTAWETVSFHWQNSEGQSREEGHVLAPGRDIGLGVISDIDDTIIETGITGGLRSLARNWRRVLAQMPDERIAVPGADEFYNALGGGLVELADAAQAGTSVPAAHRPFFYVSSSPWNLFTYLVAFKKTRNLPLGPIKLRDWGLNRDTFGSSSHGSHKTDAIRAILEMYPDLRFALIGDDSQGDLVAFADLVSEHPKQITAVFIRTTGGAQSPEEITARATINAAGVPLWLGETYTVGQEFLRAAGLAPHGDAARIISAVEGSVSNG